VAQAGLNLTIFLSLPPKCWDYRSTPPHPAVHILTSRVENPQQNEAVEYLEKHLRALLIALRRGQINPRLKLL
jgi:hypothetical protein